MWFLEHESLFGGSRIWLRPGSQQLFGRTRPGENEAPEGKTWHIDSKVVSRKHVMLKVLDALPENGTRLHARSQIEVTDLSCRQGTTVDEKETLKSQKEADGTVAYEKTTLKGTEHSIRLAQGYPPFKIVWRPVVVTYASKETREGKARSAQLHALDIKTTTEFQFDKTTHVVSAKRNLPKVLSGLTAGKHIVTADFLDALLNVSTASVDADNIYVPSKLEEDFDTWWPQEKGYIPPTGAEPVPQPQEKLLPDSTRSEVFSGLTFIFLNDGQYNSLFEPIAGGGGKALLYEVRPGETTVQEYVDYVYSVAGKKRRTAASKDKLPVITVRLPAYPDAMDEWATNFVVGTDQALGQRSILQNEFLDAIITKDRPSLQRPPSEMLVTSAIEPATGVLPTRRSIRESTPTSQAAPSQPAVETASPQQAVKAEPVKAIPRKRIQRPKTTSRFTGFDDYEPPPKKKKAESTPMEDIQQPVLNTDTETPSQANGATTSQLQTVPEAASQDAVEKEEQMDTLFPAAAKLRRERAVTRPPPVPQDADTGSPALESKHKGVEALDRLNHAKARAEKDINVLEHTRLRMQELEERRKATEEQLRERLQGIDITDLKNLVQIEEMPLRTHSDGSAAGARQHPGRAPGQEPSWKPEWNGRKNFKKFRRRGAELGLPPHKVLVALEEAPVKSVLGNTDAFFLEETLAPSRPGRRGRGQPTAVAVEEQSADSELEEPGFMRGSRAPMQRQREMWRNRTQLRQEQRQKQQEQQQEQQQHQQSEVIMVEDSEPDEEQQVDLEPVARTQRSSARTQRVAETQIGVDDYDDDDDDEEEEEEEYTPAPNPRGRKRGSEAPASGQPATKRGKAAVVTRRVDISRRVDGSDEEETGFRFQRKG